MFDSGKPSFFIQEIRPGRNCEKSNLRTMGAREEGIEKNLSENSVIPGIIPRIVSAIKKTDSCIYHNLNFF